jgi:hypothetical protein
MRFFVNGSGLVYETTAGPVAVTRGQIFDAPAGFTPGADTHNLLPMDSQAQQALVTAVNAQIAATGPLPPPGVLEMDRNPPIFAP